MARKPTCLCGECDKCRQRKRPSYKKRHNKPKWEPSPKAVIGGFVGFRVGSYDPDNPRPSDLN